MDCIFCDQISSREILKRTSNFKLVYDIDPIQEGHLLIISKEHYMNILEIPNTVLHELIELQKEIVFLLESNFSVEGVTIMQNNGRIMDEGTHFHVHVIPRYLEDSFWDNQQVFRHKLDLKKVKRLLEG
jgi:histidine triad (HIT) family protein